MAAQIDFHFNVPNRFSYACRLIRKALAQGMTIAVWARNENKLEYFSRQLWSFEPTGFYPHVKATDPLADITPIVYSHDERELPSRAALVLLDDTLPDDYATLFARYSRVFDIVPPSETEKKAARERFKFYRAQGLSPVAHDLGSKQ